MRVPTIVKTGMAVAATAVAGSLMTRPDERWYRRLDKPSWRPPRQAFPMVWTVLYGLLAYGGARAIDAQVGRRRRAFEASYAANLVLNAGWTAVFFGARRPTA